MKSKLIRLSKALRYESAKRLPWVIVLLVLLGIFAFAKSYAKTSEGVQNTNKILVRVQRLSEDNNRLSAALVKQSAQIKALSEQNNRLAKQNARHIDCIAKLFADWTQTGIPVQAVDLNTCIIQSSGQGNAASGLGNAGTSAQSSASASSQKQSAPKSSGGQSDNSQPSNPSQPEPLLNCKIDLLGMHFFCPTTKL